MYLVCICEPDLMGWHSSRARHQFTAAVGAFALEIFGALAAKGALKRANEGFTGGRERPFTVHAANFHVEHHSRLLAAFARSK
jgi:hypothetical protein